MKALRISCFILGLIALFRIFQSLNMNVPASQPQAPDAAYLFTFYAFSVICTVICVLLAKKLKRSAVGWGIFAFFLPFIACFILPFLKEGDPLKRASWWSNSGGSAGSWDSGYGNAYYSQKTCGACHREVPLSSHSGQRCPHCGAYWGAETGQKR